MPAPLDLTGQQVGQLLVLRQAQPAKGAARSWLCRCSCGAEEVVGQKRLLPYADARHAVRACRSCRLRKPCSVCGTLFVAAARTTCSPGCAAENKRRISVDHYHRHAVDPAYRQRIAAENRRRRHDPATAEQYQQAHQRALQRRAEKIRADDALRSTLNARAREQYAAQAEARAARRAEIHAQRWAAMSADQRAAWLERRRAYGRAYRAAWREDLKAHPERHTEYLRRMQEYRRQRALNKLMATGTQLTEKL